MPAKRSTVSEPAVRGHIRGYGKPVAIPAESKLLLTYEDVASQTDLPIATLRKRVRAGTGPRLTLVGKHHRFAPRDVAAWVEALRESCGA